MCSWNTSGKELCQGQSCSCSLLCATGCLSGVTIGSEGQPHPVFCEEGSQVPTKPCHFATKWDFTLLGNLWERKSTANEWVLGKTEAAFFLTSVHSGAVVTDGSQSILQWGTASDKTPYSGRFSGLLLFSFFNSLFFQVTTDTESQSLLNFLSESGKWIPR